MKKIVVILSFLFFCYATKSQNNATVKEYNKVFPTYMFSDPNPIPSFDKIYPYFRYDGFSDKAIQKEWKVVELENDFLRIMILPEIGGKIWAAIEKSTGKSFIYYNHVVKFRDVAMRGPWTSGGIEPNYGIIGHTPNCATPVDYTTMKKDDGSVSCIVGVLDLLTRTPWRLEINLPKDKAYITTSSFWYNATPTVQAYYTWMNTGLPAKGNLEFIYPGTHYLGHSGEYSDWPINKQKNKDISFYENNNFGEYKSYHVFGKYTEFFGGYWHNDDFGMARYSTHDDKPGKKIWIWGLSQQGMIWEKLLTDTDGQYVEVQSGRFFNQADVGSSYTPFKHPGFLPYATETWTEYWFPVKQTKGFVKANSFGALNIKNEDGWLKLYFSPLQALNDELKVAEGNNTVYSKKISLKTMQTFADSMKFSGNANNLVITLGNDKMIYHSSPEADKLDRPREMPANFDTASVYGLYLQAEENIHQRFFDKALQKLQACLQKDPNYAPALTYMAMLLYRGMKFDDAYQYAKHALSINTYDAAANYYYGLTSYQLGRATDAKDGFDIAALNIQYRSAACTGLAKIYFREGNYAKALHYAHNSTDFNRYNMEGWQLIAVINRLQGDKAKAEEVLTHMLAVDPLNHFARFEKYLLDNSDNAKQQFVSLIRNELPQETYLELVSWYNQLNRTDECLSLLSLAPQNAEVLYWQAFLKKDQPDAAALFEKAKTSSPLLSFPFRTETAPLLEWAMQKDGDWKHKYYLALIKWYTGNIADAQALLKECAMVPNFAPFYAARAALAENREGALADLEHAIVLDKEQWRYHKLLAEQYIAAKEYQKALNIAQQYYQSHSSNYIIGMLYAKTLLLNKRYKDADAMLAKLNIIPFEGATEGRELYREAKLTQAIQEMEKKNYKKALQFIEASKQWPENLGVGKPYDEDIDTRLEDWMQYISLVKMGKNNNATPLLQKISQKKYTYPSPNDVVTAWAMEQLNQKDEAEKWLEQFVQQYPARKIAEWNLAMFRKQQVESPIAIEPNSTMRIVEQLIKLQ